MPDLKKKITSAPQKPGVYLMKDEADKVIYVGKAINLKKRVSSYFVKNKKDIKTQKLISQIKDFEVIVVNSEEEALLLERSLIREYSPHFNILLRDDKNFPYIEIDIEEKWPRLRTVRRKRSKKHLYFGPFTSSGQLRSILHNIQEVFPLIRCSPYEFSKRKKPCHYYHMKKCLGPCTLDIKSSDYKNIIEDVIRVLKGQDKSLEKSLTEKMYEASNDENYELAASYRDQITAFKKLKDKQVVISDKDRNQDILGIAIQDDICVINVLKMRHSAVSEQRYFVFEKTFLDEAELLSSFLLEYYEADKEAKEVYIPFDFDNLATLENFLKKKKGFFSVPQKGENKKLLQLSKENANYYLEDFIEQRSLNTSDLEEIKETLGLKNSPKVMECLDISNIGETATVASIVCFRHLKPSKKDYKIYNIKGRQDKPDDYDSIREAFKRRLERAVREDDAPDVFVIDGGKGQLSAANEILKHYPDIKSDLISLAKQRSSAGEITKEERVFSVGSLKSKVLSKYSLTFRILTHLRDEAHRFAITRHRKKRSSQSFHSTLLDIKGLGPQTHKRLMEEFKTLEAIKKASVDELMKQGKVSKAIAEAIKEKI